MEVRGAGIDMEKAIAYVQARGGAVERARLAAIMGTSRRPRRRCGP